MPSTCPKPASAGDLADGLEVALSQHHPIAEGGQPRGRPGDGRLVGIEAEQAATRRAGLQDPEGVPSAADGRVDVEAARNG